MSLPAPTYQWEEEQKRWRLRYRDRLLLQLQHVAARLRRDRARPYLLRPHFQSCLSLLNHTRDQAYLNEAWLDLVAVLHPLPQRLGALAGMAGRA